MEDRERWALKKNAMKGTQNALDVFRKIFGGRQVDGQTMSRLWPAYERERRAGKAGTFAAYLRGAQSLRVDDDMAAEYDKAMMNQEFNLTGRKR